MLGKKKCRAEQSTLLIFALACACGVEPELDVWAGQHVRYESNPSLTVCGGTHAWADGFLPFVASELGVEVPKGQRYRWVGEDDLPCDSTSGCAPGSVGFSSKPFLLHELVHTTMNTLGYQSQPFFGEGIAYALDPWNGDGINQAYLIPWKGVDKLVDPRHHMTLDSDDLSYVVAGSFVMFLLARHGPGKFLRFSRELGGSRDMEVIREKFQLAYGIDLDDEAELFMVGAPCTEASFGPGIYDCTAPTLPWDGEQWVFDGVMDCANDDVAGGFGPDRNWGSVRAVTVDVPVAGRYRFLANSDAGISVRIGPCESCPWDRGGTAIDSSEEAEVELDAGVHFLRIRAQSQETLAFRIVLSPVLDPP